MKKKRKAVICLNVKKWIKAVISLCAVIVLCGCSDLAVLIRTSSSNTPSSSEGTEQSLANQIAGHLIEELSMENMEMLKERNMRALVFGGEEVYSDGVIYHSSAGKSDTVGVFYVTEFETALNDVREYVNSLEAMTNVYDMSEIFKISNAVIRDNGTDKIVLIIADDIEEAKQLADEETSR